MIRKWMFAIVAFTSIAVKAQVGIGTVTPNALLELKAKDSNNPTNSEGILIPRVKKFPTVNPEEKHHGLLVFLSENTATHQAGFYHWSHTKKAWTHVAQDYAWSLKGNAGTDPAVNFIGTTDNKPLVFGVNNKKVAWFDVRNFAIGLNALKRLETGQLNVGIGSNALENLTTGNSNLAIGDFSLRNVKDGTFNISLGFSSGTAAMSSSQGNVVIGAFALGGNVNVGSDNVAIGVSAGLHAVAGISNSIMIGNKAHAYSSNSVKIGNYAIVKITGQVPWSSISDRRVSTSISEDVPGLDFITKLRPITFNFNPDEQVRINHDDRYAIADNSDIAQIKQTGFIGQEVAAAANAIGYNFSGVNRPSTSKDLYSLSYATFVVPLVKAVQEQQQQIDKLTQKITILENKINQIENSL